MDKIKISIICVYNDTDALNNQLLLSLNKFQEKNYEMIVVDSRVFGFKSSAEALNYGARMATGDVLIFLHQDIYIKNERDFYNFSKFVYDEPIGEIIGAAGAVECSQENLTNYTSGSELELKEVHNIDAVLEVSCVDESFFAMKKETYLLHQFDEILCDDWHLYAVEMSLHARRNGNKVLVYPLQLHHYSNGTISTKYMKGLLGIADFYRGDFKYIWTTCYKVRSSWLYTRSLFCVWYIYRLIVGKPV